MISLEELIAFGESLTATTFDMKWDHHLCFNVGAKMYLITSPDESPISASFKVSDEDFENLQVREGVIPAPYMARNKWLRVDDIQRFSLSEWKEILKNSHLLIASKLTKKLQKELGLL